MNRGPESGTGKARNGDQRSFREKAAAAWGVIPDWVLALVEIADAKGLKGAAAMIGYSTTAVSQAINNKPDSIDLGRVAEKVGGALMGVTVECEEGMLGTISRGVCLDWQAKPRAASSSLRARMYHACRRCPHFRPPTSHGGGDAS